MNKIYRTNVSPVGTSFHDITVKTSLNKLITLFGKPDTGDEDKVNYEWVINVNNDICTIYDWKEYRLLDNDEIIEWHIGGYGVGSEETLKEYIQHELE